MGVTTHEDPAAINIFFRCPIKRKTVAFLGCPQCSAFPCKGLSAGDLYRLRTSPLLSIKSVILKPRRIKTMHIAKFLDGNLGVMEDLDEKNPDPRQLRNVQEIYIIGKVLIPTLTLRVKPKEERGKIVAAVEMPVSEATASNVETLEEIKQQKRKKKA